jgi:hypothetical protein
MLLCILQVLRHAQAWLTSRVASCAEFALLDPEGRGVVPYGKMCTLSMPRTRSATGQTAMSQSMTPTALQMSCGSVSNQSPSHSRAKRCFHV